MVNDRIHLNGTVYIDDVVVQTTDTLYSRLNDKTGYVLASGLDVANADLADSATNAVFADSATIAGTATLADSAVLAGTASYAELIDSTYCYDYLSADTVKGCTLLVLDATDVRITDSLFVGFLPRISSDTILITNMDTIGYMIASAIVPDSAGDAGTATLADSATNAVNADLADSATNAVNADLADYASLIDSTYCYEYLSADTIQACSPLVLDATRVGITADTLKVGDLTMITYSDSLADDASLSLPGGVSGYGWVKADTIGEREAMFFLFDADGTITKLTSSTTNTDSADTDDKLCVYDGGSYGIVKNRLAGTRKVRIHIEY
jgi:hypothetical protein